MSVSHLTVVFEENVPQDYADRIMEAIKLFDGVILVEAGMANFSEQRIAEERLRLQLAEKAFNLIMNR